ncbi:MAG: tetratricopeptide repeat-containing sensor histidine kinase, partial [Candidatus Kariarchaeaceae archaeon]
LKVRYKINDSIDEISKDHINIGAIFKSKGNLNEALNHFNKALSLSKKVGNKEIITIASTNIGSIQFDAGHLDEALNAFKGAYVIFEELGDPLKIATVQKNIGLIYKRKGEFNLALEYYTKSLDNKKAIGNEEEIARTLHSVGLLFLSKGELDTSLDHLEQSLGIWTKIGNQVEISSILKDKGIIFQQRGKNDEAENLLKRSLTIRRRIGNELEISETLFHLVLLYLDNQPELSEKHFKEIQKISKSSDNRVIKIRSRLAEAAILQQSTRMSKKVEAHELFEEVIAEELVDYELTVFAMLNLCEFLIIELKSSGEKEVLVEIQTILEKLYEMATEQESHPLLIEILIIQSKLALLDFNISEAESFLENARDIAEEKGLEQFTLKISYLQRQLENEASKLTQLAKQIPIEERIEQLDIENYLKEAAQVRDYGREATDMVVHDIKNLIQVNLNFAQLLLLDKELPEEMKRYVHFIELSSKEMQLLISSLLTTEKIENGTINLYNEQINTWDLLLQRMDLFKFRIEENHVELMLDTPDKELFVEGDKFLLRRVFDNIIHNAGKFTTPKGTFRVRVIDETDFINFIFENDSPVIPADVHDTIFEKYGQYTFDKMTKKQGVGLGLAFCRQAIELMGGSINVSSPIPGKDDGTQFQLRIKR